MAQELLDLSGNKIPQYVLSGVSLSTDGGDQTTWQEVGEDTPLPTRLRVPDGKGGYTEPQEFPISIDAQTGDVTVTLDGESVTIGSLPTPVDTVAHGDNDGAKVPVSVNANGELELASSLSVGSVNIEDSNDTTIDPATSSDVTGVADSVGDETAASQEADSSVGATAIERLTALVDALDSGQSDDHLRVELLAQALSGELPVSVDAQTGDVTVTLDGETVSVDELPQLSTDANGNLETTAYVSVATAQLEADDSQGNGVQAIERADGTNALKTVVSSVLEAAEDSIESVDAVDRRKAGGEEVSPQFAHVTPSSSGETTVVQGVNGAGIRVTSMKVMAKDSQETVEILDGSGGSALDTIYADTRSGPVQQDEAGLFQTSDGNGLVANLTTGNQVSIRVTYVEV